jgi:alpha-acetolactate decarboxylase
MIDFWVILFLLFFWAGSSFVCALFEGASRMSATGIEYTTVLDQITESSIFTADSTLGKIVGVFSPDLWSGILNMATFNYPILYGDFEFLRYIVLGTISMAVVTIIGLQVLKLIRGVS